MGMRETTPGGEAEGLRIRLAREALGWSQAELARRMNMSQEGVSSYEKGKARIPPERVPDLAAVFGMSDMQVHALLQRVTHSYARDLLQEWFNEVGVRRSREVQGYFERVTNSFHETRQLATA
jgi:transcriptional regulator with XRE-family HTH domain